MAGLTKEEEEVVTRRRNATWAARTASKDTCANPECGRYVGFEHRLVERKPGCLLGVEVDRETILREDAEHAAAIKENIAWFMSIRRPGDPKFPYTPPSGTD